MKDIVRTRFAPSPTGYMHVGNLRTALYAFLLAKQNDGTFILRIEDTDLERKVDDAIDVIYNTLKSAKLIWDEGPDVGGDFGPYIQSERNDVYLEYAKKLIDSGHAYYCFCDKERLEELRIIQKASGTPQMYDGHCKHLTKEEIEEKLKNNTPYVIRQNIPKEGSTTFFDEVYGKIVTPNEILDDNVLIKADGFPTYNFANVIDDYLMKITHIIRGSEYLSSTPKYNLLYEALNFPIPKYIHCPPVMKDENNKLSKRNGDASFEDLVHKGFLPEAILNYICLLGWSPKGEREIFSLDELIKEFSVDSISKSPSIFDIKKLRYINSEYIKNLSEDEFFVLSKPYIKQSVKNENIDIKAISRLLQVRTEILSEIPEQVDFFDTLPDYDIELFVNKKMKTDKESSLIVLEKLIDKFKNIDEKTFDLDSIHDALALLVSELEVKNGYVFYPLRVCVSGKSFTPGGGADIANIIGKEETINRIKIAINKLK